MQESRVSNLKNGKSTTTATAAQQPKNLLVFINFLQHVLVSTFELPKFAFTKSDEDIAAPTLCEQFIEFLELFPLEVTAKRFY